MAKIVMETQTTAVMASAIITLGVS